MPHLTAISASLVALLLCTSTALAQRGPERIPVLAGFVPTDDGAYRVVILTEDSVGEKPIPNYCGAGWKHGMIQSQHRSAVHNNALITNPSGCWLAFGNDRNPDQITFRYFDIAAGQKREFKIDPKMIRGYSYEWKNERLFPER